MRICLVNDYSLDHIGGAITSLLEQKKALESAGHIVFLLQLGKSNLANTINNIIIVKPNFTLGKSFYELPMLLNTKKNVSHIENILQKHAIDIIHFQSEMSLAFAVNRAAKNLTLPTVFTIHTFFWMYDNSAVQSLVARSLRLIFSLIICRSFSTKPLEGNLVEQTLKNITLTLASECDQVISPSEHMRRILESTKKVSNLVTIPNPYNSLSEPAPCLITATPHVPRIIWIGRVEPEKRPIEFIKAVQSAAASTSHPFSVGVIGDGSLLPEMKELAQALTFVTFYGKQPHQSVIDEIDRSDVVALSSYHYDNQPMIIAESISRYRPVMYCDELLTEGVSEAGILAQDKSVGAMADIIVEIAMDPTLLIALSKTAKDTQYLFSAATFVKKVEPIYLSLLQTKTALQ